MDSPEYKILESLSGNDIRIYNHLPYLLQDLYSLGSDIEILMELLERNISNLNNTRNLLELCCGKGACIISIVKKYGWAGKGIDLFPSFINEARLFSLKEGIQNIDFEVMDIRDAVNNLSNYDLVLYGSDTNYLGDEFLALKKISKCLSPGGYIIYGTAFEKDKPYELQLADNGFDIIDKIEHNAERVKQINEYNTGRIRERANQLAEKYPEEKELFYEYVKRQEKESMEYERGFLLTTLLIRPKGN